MAIDGHPYLWHVASMKTTVEIEEPLLRKAKAVAAAQGTTVKEILNVSLRLYLESKPAAIPPGSIRLHTVKGEAPALETDWGRIRSLIYEGRGE